MLEKFAGSLFDWLQAHGIDPIVVLTIVFLLVLVDAVRGRRSAKTGFRRSWASIAIWTASFIVLWGTLYALGVFPKASIIGHGPKSGQVGTQPEADGIIRDTSYWRTGWRDTTSVTRSNAPPDTVQGAVTH